MKPMIGLVVIALLIPATVFANDSTNNNTSNSASTSNSTSAAQNAGNAQSITYNSPNTSTIKSTGNATMSGFSGSFSGDYCGGTAGMAVGGVGFAVSGGGPKIDNSCVMLRTFERTQQAATAMAAVDPVTAQVLRMASLEVLAETDPKVKEIFQKRGLIPRDPEPKQPALNRSNNNPLHMGG